MFEMLWEKSFSVESNRKNTIVQDKLYACPGARSLKDALTQGLHANCSQGLLFSDDVRMQSKIHEIDPASRSSARLDGSTTHYQHHVKPDCAS